MNLAHELLRKHERVLVQPYCVAYLQLMRFLSPYLTVGDEIQETEDLEYQFDWFQSHSSYVSWLESKEPAVLFLSGAIGSGKTLLSHLLISHLKKTQDQNDVVTACFLFDRLDERCDNLTTLYLSLAGQILKSRPGMMSYVYERFSQINPETFPKKPSHEVVGESAHSINLLRRLVTPDTKEPALLPSEENINEGHNPKKQTKFSDLDHTRDRIGQAEAWVLLQTLLSGPKGERLVCVINALQECKSDMKVFLIALKSLQATVEAPFRIVLSGTPQTVRQYAEALGTIQHISLDSEESMQLQAKENVKRSVSRVLKNRPQLQQFETEIVASLCPSHHPNMLQESLRLRTLAIIDVQSTPASVRSILRSMPRMTPETVCHAIVDTTHPRLREWILQALSWLVYAFRPLHLNELASALAMKDWQADSEIVEDYLARDIETDVMQALGAVLCIQHGEIRFRHPFLRELIRGFLERNEATFTSAIMSHRLIFQVCLSYLSLPRMKEAKQILESGHWVADRNPYGSKGDSSKHGFLAYAVQYWPLHYRLIKDPSDEHTSRVASFLNDEEKVLAWRQLDPESRLSNSDPDEKTIMNPIYLSAYFGLETVMKFIVYHKLPAPVNQQYSASVLRTSAMSNHMTIVEFALSTFASHLEPTDILTALCAALDAESKDVIPILARALDFQYSGLNINLLLEKAAGAGKTDLVEHIIQKEKPLLQSRPAVFKAIAVAAGAGHASTVRLLLNSELIRQSKAGGVRSEDESGALHAAVYNGHLKVVNLLLDNGAQVAASNEWSQSALHIATISGFPPIVKQLLNFDANVNARDRYLRTPLHYAAQYGFVKGANLLMKSGGLVDAQDIDNETPLQVAIYHQRAEMVQILLEAGARAQQLNKQEEPALHLALSEESLPIVEQLLKFGAEVNCKNRQGLTPLMRAASRLNHPSAAKVLLGEGADIMLEDSEGLTALHWSCKSGNVAAALLLLDSGADVNAEDNRGERPIHIAAKRGDMAVLEALLDKEVFIEAFAPPEYRTALHYAVGTGTREIVKMLLDGGAEVDVRTRGDTTPITIAAQRGHPECLKLLLESRPARTLVAREPLGRLLPRAAAQGLLDTVRVLLNHGANVRVKDFDGESVLAKSIRGRSLDITKLVLEAESNLNKNADLNTTDADGSTPLAAAIMKGDLEMAILLLEHGADFRSTCGRWGNAFNAAVIQGAMATNTLLDNGASITNTDQHGRGPMHMVGVVGDLDLFN